MYVNEFLNIMNILKVSSWIFNRKSLPAGQAVVSKMPHKYNKLNYYCIHKSQIWNLGTQILPQKCSLYYNSYMCWPLGWFQSLIFDFVSYLFRESDSTGCKKLDFFRLIWLVFTLWKLFNEQRIAIYWRVMSDTCWYSITYIPLQSSSIS